MHFLLSYFFLSVFSLVVASIATILLYFVRTSLQNLTLCCIFEALTSLGISAVYCVMVDMFPTNLRVMAAALALTFGRGGALMGNLLFGFLIDLNCVVPIVIFGAMLFGKLSVLRLNENQNEKHNMLHRKCLNPIKGHSF